MTLIDGFKAFAKEASIDLSGVIKKRMGNDATVLYFAVESDEDIKYMVMLVLYDDNKLAEIWVSKNIRNLNILPKVNNLNLDYRYYTFALENNSIVIKSSVNTNSDFKIVSKNMLQMINVANEEFKKFN